MNKGDIIDFKVADVPCRLIIKDPLLFSYFKDNYWENTKVIPLVKIYIKGFKNNYQITSEPINLKLSFNLKKRKFLFKDVDWIVRTILQFNMIKYKILFVHSSGFVKKRQAFIFLGRSGYGKSTVINNFPKKKIIGDDIIIVKKENECFYAYQSPFEKKRLKTKVTLKNVSVKSLFIIVKGNLLKTEPDANKEILSLLLTDNYLPRLPGIHEGKINKKNTLNYNNFILKLVGKTRSERLFFPKKFKHEDFIVKYG